MGLSPLIADTVPHTLKKYLGMVGYLIWARAGRGQIPPVPADRRAGRQADKRLGNRSADRQRHHHGGVELIESAELDSGEIVVQAVTGKSVFGLAWSWFATLFKLSPTAS